MPVRAARILADIQDFSDVFTIRAIGAVKFKQLISSPCLNAAWNMIKEESEQRRTECTPQCHVWSCLCLVSAGGTGLVILAALHVPADTAKNHFLFVYLAILC